MRRTMPSIVTGLCLAVLLAVTGGAALAQGLEAGKDCHVVRTCDFRESAEVRGCLSSYSCRQCRFVPRQVVSFADGLRRTEYRTLCTWGEG